MNTFNIDMPHNGEIVTLSIIPKDDYFKITYAGRMLGATKKEGSDWILMQQDELNLTGNKLNPQSNDMILGAAEINQIAGEIENHLK